MPEPLPHLEPTRPLGRTGFVATALGIGDVADRAVRIEQCVTTARRAIDAGLNLIDTAPNYEDGYSEQIVGRAVKGVRDRMFVISKIDHFDEPIEPQVDGSLGRLQMDHVDLFVFHGLSTLEAWEKAAVPGGAFEALGRCAKAGKLRFRGISCHNPEVLRVAIPSGLCDVVMFAVGPYVDDRYVTEILPLAKKHNVGTVCFKTFGAGKLLGDTSGYQRPLAQRPRGKISSGGSETTEAVLPRLTVQECLHYTMSLGPDVALLGMSFPNEQDAAFAAAKSFTGPLSASAMADIRERGKLAIAEKGPCWWNPQP
jgi:aryl-alcohol dehydrogenase-like predicted oxidoreductase